MPLFAFAMPPCQIAASPIAGQERKVTPSAKGGRDQGGRGTIMKARVSRRGFVTTAACAGAVVVAPVAFAAEQVPSAQDTPKDTSYKAGTYTGTGTGHNGAVTCRVTFSRDAITDIEIVDQAETPTMFAQVKRYIPGCIVDGQTLNVEAVSGATMSTNAILDAVAGCVAQAGGDADVLREAEAAPESAVLSAGLYTGTAHGHHSDVTVEVALSTGSIESVTVIEAGETFNVGDSAINTLPGRIVGAQGIGVDTCAGATFTSRAILTATADALEQAGGAEAVRAFAHRQRAAAVDVEPQKVAVDVVVVGSGLAGIAAALSAQDEGASVALLEKLPYTGGTSQTSGGGLVGPNDDSPEGIDYFAQTQMHFQCGCIQGETQDEQYPNPDLVDMLSENAIADFAWLGEKGMQYAYYSDMGEYGSGFTSGCAVTQFGKPGAVTSPNVMGMNEQAMLDTFTAAGGTVYTECAATELIMDDGAVHGVKAQGAAGSHEFTCRGVVLAAGGFGANPAMVAELAPAYKGEENWTLVSCTGDGIQMGIDAGGAVYDSGLMMGNHGHAVMTDGDMISPYSDAVTPYQAFYVNPRGLRVNRERPISYTGGSSYVNPDTRDYYWAIVNDEVARASEYIDFLEEHLAEGDPHFHKADTLPELARGMNVSVNTLRYSLNRYNGFCEAGEDEDYHKDPADLVAMPQDSGPWYATKMDMAYFGTVGGLVINTDCAVLDTEGNPIPGLFAAGENANHGFFNVCYQGGRSLTVCAVCGRKAGAGAARA